MTNTQQAPSGTVITHKTGTLGRLFRTGKGLATGSGEFIDGILKGISADINTSSTSFSGTLSELLDHAKGRYKQYSPIDFSVTRVLATLVMMLKAAVAEAEKYFRTKITQIELGLAEARLSLRTMDLQKLVSPQTVSRVLSFSGISYNRLILFYVRQFIFGLAWSLSCQLPLAERHSLSNLVCRYYSDYLDQPSSEVPRRPLLTLALGMQAMLTTRTTYSLISWRLRTSIQNRQHRKCSLDTVSSALPTQRLLA